MSINYRPTKYGPQRPNRPRRAPNQRRGPRVQTHAGQRNPVGKHRGNYSQWKKNDELRARRQAEAAKARRARETERKMFLKEQKTKAYQAWKEGKQYTPPSMTGSLGGFQTVTDKQMNKWRSAWERREELKRTGGKKQPIDPQIAAQTPNLNNPGLIKSPLALNEPALKGIKVTAPDPTISAAQAQHDYNPNQAPQSTEQASFTQGLPSQYVPEQQSDQQTINDFVQGKARPYQPATPGNPATGVLPGPEVRGLGRLGEPLATPSEIANNPNNLENLRKWKADKEAAEAAEREKGKQEGWEYNPITEKAEKSDGWVSKADKRKGRQERSKAQREAQEIRSAEYRKAKAQRDKERKERNLERKSKQAINKISKGLDRYNRPGNVAARTPGTPQHFQAWYKKFQNYGRQRGATISPQGAYMRYMNILQAYNEAQAAQEEEEG